MKRVILTLLTLLSLAAGAMAATWPERIDLPDGYQPEGIASGPGKSLFVGSIPTGEIRKVNARTGNQKVVVGPGSDRAAIGLKYRKGKLWVAGGAGGEAFVYGVKSGDEIARFQLTENPDTFVNDVAVTNKSAFFTDSRQPVIYRVGMNFEAVFPIRLAGFPMQEGFNLNGIETAQGGKLLLAIQGNAGILWRIDPATGRYGQVDLGGEALPNGDGLLLVGKRTLYVVQNRLNKVAVVKLSKNLESGEIVRSIESDAFDVPTTVARKGRRLYLPNARFTTPPEAGTDYWITRVRR